MDTSFGLLAGRVATDPKINKTNTSTVARFRLAKNSHYVDSSGQKKDRVDYYTIVAYGTSANIVEKWVKKGTGLCVETDIRTHKWTDKKGSIHEEVTFVISKLHFTDRKPASQGAEGAAKQAGTQEPASTIMQEEIAPSQEIIGEIPEEEIPF